MDRSRQPKKRAFEQGRDETESHTDVLEYSDSEEKMANLRRKGKEVLVAEVKGLMRSVALRDQILLNVVPHNGEESTFMQIMVQDVIVVDDGGCLHMIDDVKHGGDYKGKGLLYPSSNDSDSDDKKSSSSTSAATDVVADGDYSNNFMGQSSDTDQDDSNYYDDDDLEYLPENGWYGTNEISYLQTQFEKAAIPPDIEVDIPWWTDPGHKNSKPFNLSDSSNGKGTQPMLDSGGEPDETAVPPETKSTGGSISSANISCPCTNELNSVPYKHGSLPNNYAADSFTPAQTKTPGGSSGTLEPKSLKEAAMMRVQQFVKFAVVDDYSDHHYANRPSKMQLEKASTKKIMDEWRILQSSLPDTIFVRVYDAQVALLRAVIIGPQGTPYHDGLFFFDMMFPSNYPERPPHVHYYSGGLRLNPNLYESGKVCLSLLGTWPGRSATENWIPGNSTLLQVLISIQGLILNAEPYFNEPAHSIYGDKNAAELYNEETLLKSLKTMIYSMKKPPRHFEEFVPDYFITHSRDILLACSEYMKGAQVGSVSIVEGKAVNEKDKRCSRNFRESVGCYMNSLIDEFAKHGVNDCDEFRVPASNIKAAAVDFKSMSNFFAHKLAEAKFKTSSSQFPSAPFPTAPGVGYPYSPYPAAAPDDAYMVPSPSPLSTMTSQLLFPHLAAYPFAPPPPHIAMSSSSTPWNPSLSLSGHGANPPIRFGSPQSHLRNIRPVVNLDLPAGFRSSQPPMPNLRNQKPSKPDDELKGNVHKWSDC